ncbi:hypothetical protein K7432_010738 [Basidiobolus ranarum]|uniref:Uncharacterized protein n=1 Tax=Basidiobolus ranarum TaxID=34480 RepID=A0ABR2VVF4_9FUNG
MPVPTYFIYGCGIVIGAVVYGVIALASQHPFFIPEHNVYEELERIQMETQERDVPGSEKEPSLTEEEYQRLLSKKEDIQTEFSYLKAMEQENSKKKLLLQEEQELLADLEIQLQRRKEQVVMSLENTHFPYFSSVSNDESEDDFYLSERNEPEVSPNSSRYSDQPSTVKHPSSPEVSLKSESSSAVSTSSNAPLGNSIPHLVRRGSTASENTTLSEASFSSWNEAMLSSSQISDDIADSLTLLSFDETDIEGRPS